MLPNYRIINGTIQQVNLSLSLEIQREKETMGVLQPLKITFQTQ